MSLLGFGLQEFDSSLDSISMQELVKLFDMSGPSGKEEISALFAAIKDGKADVVRQMLLSNKSLIGQKFKSPEATFDKALELDAIKFLGAYIGALTPLHFAILLGHDQIAKVILERTAKADLDEKFGQGNTALHLATLLGATEIVRDLIESGATKNLTNNQGFTPVDLSDDDEMRKLF